MSWRKSSSRLMMAIPMVIASEPHRSSLGVKQQRFILEFLIDFCGKAAAVRAGYSAKTAEVQASRLLRNAKVQAAIEKEMQARRERLQVDADTVVREFARIAFANARDFVPRKGKEFDLHRLNSDLTAAVEYIERETMVDRRTGETHRRLRLKLFDKISALNSLARHLGLFGDKQVLTGSIEARVAAMTPAQRLARVEELHRKARAVYLPLYLKEQRPTKGQPTIDWTTVTDVEPANDNAAEQVDERASHSAPSRRLAWTPSASLGGP